MKGQTDFAIQVEITKITLLLLRGPAELMRPGATQPLVFVSRYGAMFNSAFLAVPSRRSFRRRRFRPTATGPRPT